MQITLQEKAFNVYDGSAQATPTLIDFNDLIGQPTWIGPGQMQFNCVMRADLTVGAYVKMPPAQVAVTTAAAASPCGTRWRSPSTWPSPFPMPGCGRPIQPPGPARAASAPR